METVVGRRSEAKSWQLFVFGRVDRAADSCGADFSLPFQARIAAASPEIPTRAIMRLML